MSISMKSLALNVLCDSTSATARKLVYSATNGIAQIDQITVYSKHATTAYDIYICIAANTTTSGTLYPIQKINIGALSSEIATKLIAHKIPSGGSLQVYDSGSGADLYVTVSGVERQQ